MILILFTAEGLDLAFGGGDIDIDVGIVGIGVNPNADVEVKPSLAAMSAKKLSNDGCVSPFALLLIEDRRW